MYNFIAKMALEFRLSLDNICRLLGKEPTDENKMDIYNKIIELNWELDAKNAYSYLFNYETINEDPNVAVMAYTKAKLFLKKYGEALKANDQEKLISLRKELTRTEEEFNRIKNLDELSLGEEEITIISRYRLKHCVSKSKMGYMLNVHRDSLSRAENKITNSTLREKLVKLSEFYEDIAINSRKKK